MTLAEMLARNARMFPQRTALVERTPSEGLRKTVSWAVLNERVDRIAGALSERGVKRGDRVALWMLNSLNWLEAYLGIIRVGAWAVPLNHRFTGAEFQYCMAVAEPAALFLGEEFAERAGAEMEKAYRCAPENMIVTGKTPPPGMTEYEGMIERAPAFAGKAAAGADDPCGLYFTSGTTGDPKPILLTHGNMECAAITAVVHGMRKPGDVFIILKPLYHTGDKMHWLASLILGETAVIQRERITPQAIFAAIHEERGAVAMLLVPWVQDILAALESGGLKREDYDLSSWRLAMFGAQPVPPTLLKRWQEHFPEMAWEINYGLTESSGPGCIHLSGTDGDKVGALGKPGFNWEARIVDEDGRQLERGQIGEIALKGNGVMKEYFRNEKLTAETIRDGWLHTGDMGRMDADGFIWLVDRKKDIIIYGGENIYPVEIEEALQGHPKIHDAAVIGVADGRLGEAVAAVIELEAQCKPSEELEQEIRLFCDNRLPRYKRPGRIFFDEVPRSPTGKIEKLTLRRKYGG